MSVQSTIRKGLVAVKLITGHDRDVLASEKGMYFNLFLHPSQEKGKIDMVDFFSFFTLCKRGIFH